MSLEGLLALAGIAIAVVALADPVRQAVLARLVPKEPLVASFVGSFILIELPDLVQLWGCELHPGAQFAANLGAFVLPLLALGLSWSYYDEANVVDSESGFVAALVDASVLENRFHEVRRVLNRNEGRLKHLKDRDLLRLFDRRVVREVTSLGSFVHLELLSDMDLLKSLPNRYNVVDEVVRELVIARDSPLCDAVVDKYGGDELADYSDEDEALIERTFQKPDWYVTANAHYPLLLQALERLREGGLDQPYNGIDRNYDADQGTSSRSQCPILLAEKTITMAVLQAAKDNVDDDFYVTDLWWLYQGVLERSKHDPTVWSSELANSTTPTPYSYLLRAIMEDFREILGRCLETAVAIPHDGGEVPVVPQQVVGQLSRSWRMCVIELARSSGRVSGEFKIDDVKAYLNVLLQIRLAIDRYAPLELVYGVGGSVNLEEWWDLFLEPWKQSSPSAERAEGPFQKAFDRLDVGKEWVSHGKAHLESALGMQRT